MLNKLVYWLTIKPRLNRLQRILPKAKIYPCGSRYVCNPPVFFTDIDFLVYSKTPVIEVLTALGFSVSFHKYFITSCDNFLVWRKGVINLITSMDVDFANRWNVCTHISKSENLTDKADRIMVYEALRGNFDPDWLGKDFNPKVKNLLIGFNGRHGKTMIEVYKAQHGIKGVTDD